MSKCLKIATSGKGGVEKRNMSALICELFDLEANLGMAHGFGIKSLQSGDKERTGSEPMFTFNPQVSDNSKKFV
jgi:hypothetical protein